MTYRERRDGSGYSFSHCGGIIANRDNPRRAHQVDKLAQDFLTSPPLSGVMLTVGERIACIMRMEWEYIPQEYMSIDLIEHPPDHRRCAFNNCFTDCWAASNEVPTSGVTFNMDVVSQGHPGATATSIAQVTTDPERVHSIGLGPFYHPRKRFGSLPGSIDTIVDHAPIGIWIEGIFKAECCDHRNKRVQLHSVASSGSKRRVRASRLPTIMPPSAALSLRNTSYP